MNVREIIPIPSFHSSLGPYSSGTSTCPGTVLFFNGGRGMWLTFIVHIFESDFHWICHVRYYPRLCYAIPQEVLRLSFQTFAIKAESGIFHSSLPSPKSFSILCMFSSNATFLALYSMLCLSLSGSITSIPDCKITNPFLPYLYSFHVHQ